jgi:hypothetical protein
MKWYSLILVYKDGSQSYYSTVSGESSARSIYKEVQALNSNVVGWYLEPDEDENV